ncbi:MAG: alkaline phosphatase family protein [Armatimonadota bacterium]|nr:alkaline phosphatase family protein [Armatimonadota bacterium]MDR7452200.1 alkaline phosphatase family protein [Armatimonadota bacterium]MDR7468033.1 alkaline phosphatase family protein [Armatimonadota bacterium]MDR7494926.1 alkaline phosphatase family protein [Armatimonadota bacterium]MDR7500376.1 alkaline phosphatase family protein [Armatimonadota bacterium]
MTAFARWLLTRRAASAVRAIGLLVFVAVIVAATAGGAPPAWGGAGTRTVRHVVILSVDGARADATRQVFPPALLARAAYSWTAQTTLPSSTLPAHTSMLTGVPPSVHGMRSNPDNPPGRIRRPTVFSVVTRHGGRTAAFVTKRKLLWLVPSAASMHAVYLPYPRYAMPLAAEEAMRYLTRYRPDLLFLHVSDPDARGHASGWMSEPYLAAMRKVPDAVSAILEALAGMGRLGESLLIVTADHGGTGRRHGGAAPEETTIPWLAFGAVTPGAIGGPVMIYDTAATAIAGLGLSLPAGWRGRPVIPVAEQGR